MDRLFDPLIPNTSAIYFCENISIHDIRKIKPLVFAKQITIIESVLFRAITKEELLSAKWDSKDKERFAPNICRSVGFFNQLCLWVQTEILWRYCLVDRTKILLYFIKVATKLVRLNNFLSATAIVSGLLSQCIYRLTKTWDNLSDKQRAAFQSLEKLLGPDNNFNRHYQQMSSIPPPAIPYLGVYLSSLSYLRTASRIVDGQSQANVLQKAQPIIDSILHFQETNYDLPVSRELNIYLCRLGFIDSLWQLYSRDNLEASIRLEPTTRQSAVGEPAHLLSPFTESSPQTHSFFFHRPSLSNRPVSPCGNRRWAGRPIGEKTRSPKTSIDSGKISSRANHASGSTETMVDGDGVSRISSSASLEGESRRAEPSLILDGDDSWRSHRSDHSTDSSVLSISRPIIEQVDEGSPSPVISRKTSTVSSLPGELNRDTLVVTYSALDPNAGASSHHTARLQLLIQGVVRQCYFKDYSLYGERTSARSSTGSLQVPMERLHASRLVMSRRSGWKRFWASLVMATYAGGERAAFVVYFEARCRKAVYRCQFDDSSPSVQCILFPPLQHRVSIFSADPASLYTVDCSVPALLSAINSWLLAYSLSGVFQLEEKKQRDSLSTGTPRSGWHYWESTDSHSFLLSDIYEKNLFCLSPISTAPVSTNHSNLIRRPWIISRLIDRNRDGSAIGRQDILSSLVDLRTERDPDQLRLCSQWITLLASFTRRLEIVV